MRQSVSFCTWGFRFNNAIKPRKAWSLLSEGWISAQALQKDCKHVPSSDDSRGLGSELAACGLKNANLPKSKHDRTKEFK